MGEHGTREDEIDDLLRGEVLVDLYRVTRQALRASVAELLDQGGRGALRLRAARPSVARRQRVGRRLRGVARGAASSRCSRRSAPTTRRTAARSTSSTAGCSSSGRPICRGALPPEAARAEGGDRGADRRARSASATELLAGAEEGDPRWLLAQLLEYHRREEKPQWWEYFHHLSLDEEELIEDGDTIGGLELVGEPVPDKQSLVYTFTFPPQEHKIGGDGVDPATEQGLPRAGRRRARHSSRLRRAKARADEPLPTALIPPRPLRDVRAARRRPALRARTTDGAYPALRRDPRAAAAAGAARRDARSRPRYRSTAATSSSRARPARARPGTARAWRSR